MRPLLVPAILQKDPDVVREMVLALRACATEIQIDVIDGKFADATTCQAKDFSQKDFVGISLEVDAMVNDSDTCARAWAAIGAKRIVLHCESKPSAQLIMELSEMGITPVISKNIETPLATLELYVHLVSTVQFMTVKAGAQGQAFNEEAVTDIRIFRKKYPIHDVSVDGGITEEHIRQLTVLGVSRFAIGSALGNRPDGMCTRLKSLQKTTLA